MGRFNAGQTKLKMSGRKQGTPNRRTLALKELLETLDCDLPTKILELMPLLTPEKQVDVYLDLMPYVYPKRKAIEHEVSVSTESSTARRLEAMTTEQINTEIREILLIMNPKVFNQD